MGMPNPGPPGEHYFTAEPTASSRRRHVRLTLPDLQLDLLTDRGVFAGQAVDPGTKLLLATAPAPATGDTKLLDLGCGYGPIAVALALRAPWAQVWAVDVNRRALALTAQNAAVAGVVERVMAVTPDAVPPEVRFAAIYSNPPVRVGKKALHAMLSRWLGRLEVQGVAWLVVRKHLGSDSLASWLTTERYRVDRVVSRMGYRILRVERP